MLQTQPPEPEKEEPEKAEEEEPTAKRRNRRISGDCEVCKQSGSAAKYRCPGCGVVYCSAACFGRHRSDSGCSGTRDRTGFVPLDAMTDAHMLSDYGLLEDARRRKDSGYRALRAVGSLERHPWRAQALVARAAERGTALVLMPEGMTRRKTNTTRHDRRADVLFWKVELLFSSSSPSAAVVAPAVDERRSLSELLAEVLSDPCTRHALGESVAAADEMRFLLVDCDSPSHAQLHYALDASAPLRMALKDKRILEHPQIRVVAPADASRFALKPADAAVADASSSVNIT